MAEDFVSKLKGVGKDFRSSFMQNPLQLWAQLDPTTGFLPELLDHYYAEPAVYLARGSFGVVFKMLPKGVREGEEHAIKWCATTGLTPEGQADLCREVMLLSDVSHESLVKVHGVYICTKPPPGLDLPSPPFICIAMEFVNGDVLSKLVTQPNALQARALAPKLIKALAYAHDRGICHGDIHAGNIMVTPLMEVKIIDFGLASYYVGNGTKEKTNFNQEYGPPEAFQGIIGQPPQDCWALGLVLGEMSLGRLVTQLPGQRGYPISPGGPAYLQLRHLLAYLRPSLEKLLDPNPATRMSMRQALHLFDSHPAAREATQPSTLTAAYPMYLVPGAPAGAFAIGPAARPVQKAAAQPSARPWLVSGARVVYHARSGPHFLGSVTRPVNGGWEVSLEATDSKGRNPMSKHVADVDLWRLQPLENLALPPPGEVRPLGFTNGIAFLPLRATPQPSWLVPGSDASAFGGAVSSRAQSRPDWSLECTDARRVVTTLHPSSRPGGKADVATLRVGRQVQPAALWENLVPDEVSRNTVSRDHFEVTSVKGELLLKNLSYAGTNLNGVLMQATAPLCCGDVIGIGFGIGGNTAQFAAQFRVVESRRDFEVGESVRYLSEIRGRLLSAKVVEVLCGHGGTETTYRMQGAEVTGLANASKVFPAMPAGCLPPGAEVSYWCALAGCWLAARVVGVHCAPRAPGDVEGSLVTYDLEGEIHGRADSSFLVIRRGAARDGVPCRTPSFAVARPAGTPRAVGASLLMGSGEAEAGRFALWLGSIEDALDVTWLREQRIAGVINMALGHCRVERSELCEPCLGDGAPSAFCAAWYAWQLGRVDFEYLAVDALDQDYPISSHFDEVSQFLESSRKRGRAVLVHCFAGINRSAIVCAAFLLRCGLDVEWAVALVRSKRPGALTNAVFLAQLREVYAHSCSARDVLSGRGVAIQVLSGLSTK